MSYISPRLSCLWFKCWPSPNTLPDQLLYDAHFIPANCQDSSYTSLPISTSSYKELGHGGVQFSSLLPSPRWPPLDSMDYISHYLSTCG